MSKATKDDTLDEIAESIDATAQAAGIVDFEAIENAVETFDQVFAADPLASKYKAFGMGCKDLWDSTDDCIEIVRMGMNAYDLMKDEKSINPAGYDRAKVIEKLRMSMVLCGSPIVMAPQEIVAVFWVYMLERSIPGDENEPRSYRHGLDESWFGGNISVSALRVLDNVIHKASKKDEIDVWEYDAHWEAWCRAQIARLRRNDLSVRQLEALIKSKKAAIDKAHEEAARIGKTPAQIAEMEMKKLQREQEAKHNKLKSLINTMQDYAQEELKMDMDDVSRLLVNKGVIAPPAKLNNKGFAKQMTPGDAKALVECIVELIPSDPVRYATILKTLTRACQDAVRQMKSASDNVKTVAA